MADIKIEDVIHIPNTSECELRDDFNSGIYGGKIDGLLIDTQSDFIEIKPIIRPLSDMTEGDHHRWLNGANSYQSYAMRIKYLLDRQFDLFGLIEAGLAIDKTKIHL